jgi:phage tail-like protein
MRRRRLPGRRSRRNNALVVHQPSTDFRYLEQVVSVQFPIRAARSYLQRNMANRIAYRLVEVQRGETPGTVRMVEIRHANSGERTWIRGERVLANGQPASFYVPDHLVSIKPVVEGAAHDERNLSTGDEVILHVPVRGYLRFLPAIFQGEGPVHSRALTRTRTTELQRYMGRDMPQEQAVDVEVDEDPMRRFLFLFQHVMTTVTEKIDHLVDLTDPLACDARFLPWLASWVGFELDESLPVHQQRELVRRAIRLMRTRGTRHGIEEMVRVLTSAPVRVEERERPQPMVLGRNHLIGGHDVVERYHRTEPVGCYLLEPTERADTSFFTLRLEPRERFRNRFGERAAQVLRRIVTVVSQERPTHVVFVIRFDDRRTSGA